MLLIQSKFNKFRYKKILFHIQNKEQISQSQAVLIVSVSAIREYFQVCLRLKNLNILKFTILYVHVEIHFAHHLYQPQFLEFSHAVFEAFQFCQR